MTSKRENDPRQIVDDLRESAKKAGATPMKLKIKIRKNTSSRGKSKF